MKKSIAFLSVMVLSLSVFTACKKSDTSSSSTVTSSTSSSSSSIVSSESTSMDPSSNSSDYDTYSYILENTKRVGAEGKGFIDVPEEWVNFVDTVPNTDFQYSNVAGTQIITMNKVDLGNLSKEQIEQISLKQYAESYQKGLELQYGSDILDTSSSSVTVNGIEGCRVFTNFTDTSILIGWFVKGDDGNIYAIFAEGPEDSSGELITLVENTYNPTK